MPEPTQTAGRWALARAQLQPGAVFYKNLDQSNLYRKVRHKTEVYEGLHQGIH